jgi:hypothetical protein
MQRHEYEAQHRRDVETIVRDEMIMERAAIQLLLLVQFAGADLPKRDRDEALAIHADLAYPQARFDQDMRNVVDACREQQRREGTPA